MNILTNAWQTLVVLVIVLCLGIYIGTQFSSSCPVDTNKSSPSVVQTG